MAEIRTGDRPAGIEIAGHSVSSPGIESAATGASNADRAAALRGSSPQLRWVDTERRGYVTVGLTPDSLAARWHFMDTVRTPSLALAGGHQLTARRGANVWDA